MKPDLARSELSPAAVAAFCAYIDWLEARKARRDAAAPAKKEAPQEGADTAAPEQVNR